MKALLKKIYKDKFSYSQYCNFKYINGVKVLLEFIYINIYER